MEKQGLSHISPSVCNSFLSTLYKGRTHSELTDQEKLIEKSVLVLLEFMQTGTIVKKCKVRYLDGPLGAVMQRFLVYKQSRCLKKVTLDKIESHLSAFNFYLSAHSIFSVQDIAHPHIIDFIKSLAPHKKSLIHDTLMDLRGLFTFLFDQGMITKNIAAFVPKDNYQQQAKLPSYYSEEEIGQLLKSIDRGNLVGKRDYAILVLAAYLGLRASDIARLQFGNLHWERQTIVLRQYKTGQDLTLPLPAAVGNALIDYIQYGRPLSDQPFVFLLVTSPFPPIRPQTIAGMINRRFLNAGFKSTHRRHGGHALRHSLVKELLNQKQSLPVISEVLGHRNTASTRHYIRIDQESLSQCALDVPFVNPSFYTQEGGVLFI
jgi:site-specific recombinase XerD